MIQADLIYDIGAHNGDDTFWYLQQGYRVIAVEANPHLAQELEKRFSLAIQQQQLTVLGVAITEKDNDTIPFFISRADWCSSTNRSLAERNSMVVQTTEIPTTRLSSLFEKYGTPHYCKIDIEGNDAIAVKSLSGQPAHPEYISCELSCETIGDLYTNNHLLFKTLNALQEAGYNSFQLIDQDSLLQLANEKYYQRLHTLYSRARTKIERLTGWYTSRYSNRHQIAKSRRVANDFVTSPFGNGLKRTWANYETTRQYIESHFNDYYVHTPNKQMTFWVDVHARSATFTQ